MPTPYVSTIELTSGSDVALTTDASSPAYNEFALYGSNLSGVTSVELNSGSAYSWIVASVSASSNSITLSAYAYGSSSGTATVTATVRNNTSSAQSPGIELAFTELPLID